MGVNGLRLGGPIVATSNAFKCNVRCSSFVSVSHLNNVFIGKAAVRPHRKGLCPHVTRAPSKVLGTMNLRGGNTRCFISRVCPRVGGVSAGVVMGIDNSSIRACIRYTRGVTSLSGVPTVRLGVSYPGMGRKNVTFKIAAYKTDRIIGTIHGICPGALVMGLSPGIASVARVTETIRTRKTSSISLVGAVLKVTVSTRGHGPMLSAVANNLSNPYMGPITLQVM